MAYELGYPVDFRSGGDTTKEAFSKHINEIKRIYSYLNDLDTKKASTSNLNNANTMLQNHINSTNPHPNWTPSFSNISGSLDGAKLSGSVSAALINGLLSNAKIDASNVNNLPQSTNIGFSCGDSSENGCEYTITLNGNPFIMGGWKLLQAPKILLFSADEDTILSNLNQISFKDSFNIHVSGMLATMGNLKISGRASGWQAKFQLSLHTWSKDSFTFNIFSNTSGDSSEVFSTNAYKVEIYYIAVGH